VQPHVTPLKIMAEENTFFRPILLITSPQNTIAIVSTNDEAAKLTKIFPPNLATFIDIP